MQCGIFNFHSPENLIVESGFGLVALLFASGSSSSSESDIVKSTTLFSFGFVLGSDAVSSFVLSAEVVDVGEVITSVQRNIYNLYRK